ncbi:MAG: hypothetical protein EHM58_06895 [Ignavibacteriae bacterium]|nr:MAG: hypothetical protein EHM58_06895 [Ignavibacteriota bacterium]
MEEYPDYEELLKLLNKHKVEYLVIGGYAVSFHSSPLFTEDIDIWINNTNRNAGKAFKALNEFGIGNIPLEENELTNNDLVLQLGYRPVRIDILTGVGGLKFTDAYKRRDVGKFFNVNEVNYLSYEDLIFTKTKAGREKDVIGLSWLKKHRKKK